MCPVVKDVSPAGFLKNTHWVRGGTGLLTPHTIQQALSACATTFSIAC